MKFNYWRKLEPDCFYHIYNRAVDNEVLFRDKIDYQFFLKKYSEYLHPYLETYAYYLIPNHFHIIIKVKQSEEFEIAIREEVTQVAQNYIGGSANVNDALTDQMRRLFSSFALKFNNRHGRKGPLITPKVKRVVIDNDDRLRYLIAYVHHNPIHHKIHSAFNDWKYSSFNAYSSDKATLLSKLAVLKLFNGVDNFIEFHNAFQVEKKYENID